MLVLGALHVLGQATFTKEDYLQKSKNQKKTGLILLGGGTLMAVIGAVSFNNSYASSDNNTTDASGFLFLGGLAADFISIPFFISSSNNAQKAATLSFKNQPVENFANQQFQPTITLSIKLGSR